MSHQAALGQVSNIQPPTLAAIIAVTLDVTSRAYDLGSLVLAGQKLVVGAAPTSPPDVGDMYLTLHGDVIWYYAFSPVTGTIDNTAKDAAGAALTQGATYAARAEAGENVRVRINRVKHRWLIVQGSGAGVLRGWVSSEAVGR
jgi:hypothetical protein